MRRPSVFAAVWVALAGLSGRLDAQTVQISPVGSVASGKILLAQSTGNTVTFSITNQSSTTDHQYSATCPATGNVTISNCPTIGLVGALQTVVKTVTFSVGAAGAGSVQMSVTSSTGGGSNNGTWTTTTVNPTLTVSPNGTTVQVAASRTGLTQAFTVSNTSRGAGTFAAITACSGSGVSGCTVNPATIFLDSAGVAGNTGTVTVTYNSLTNPNNIGTVGTTLRFAGANVATGSITIHAISSAVTPTTQTVNAGPNLTGVQFQYSVTNSGPSAADINLDFSTCTVVQNCRFQPSGATKTINVGAGASTPVVVLYDTPANGTGTLGMRASFAGVAQSTGTLTINLTPAPTVTAVVPTTFTGPNAGSQQQQFTVTNLSPQATFTFSHNCASMPAPAAAVSCSVSPPSLLLSTNSPATVTVTFTGGATKPSQSTMTLTATASGIPSGNGSASIVISNPIITAPSAANVAPSTTGTLSTFTVVNQGPVTTPYFFTAVRTGTVTASSMSSGATGTLVVGNNPPHSAVVSFNTGASFGAGTVTLEARVQSTTGPILATATQNITVTAPSLPMVLDIVGAAYDSALYRGQCIAAAIGQWAASECGDLRIVHPLPTVKTMNVPRTPTLVYSSAHAHPWISVPVNITLPAGAAVPTTVSAVLKIAATPRGTTHSWSGGQWSAGATRRVTFGFDASAAPALATGVYAYTLEVTSTFPGGGTQLATKTGQLVVVDRKSSVFGAGWWVAGVEQLNTSNQALLTWVGGDGSVRQYARQGTSNVWSAPTMTYPDNIRKVGTEYIRQLPDSVWVYFNAQGLHIKTRNRLGHVTSFGYDAANGNRLSTITLPPTTSPLTYTFNYTAGKLSSVTAPGATAARTVTVTVNAGTGRTTAIQDPGTPLRIINFGYGADHRITSRTNGNGGVTTFWYDGASKVKADTLVLANGQKIGHAITSLQSYGLNGAAVLVDSNQVKLQIDGPNATNTVSFRANKYGSPTRITDAANQNTSMERTKAGFPGLVTRLITVLGQPIDAVYDARGRITSSSQIASTGQTAITTYNWHGTWDQLTKIIMPEGDFVDFDIDPANGNRRWQQDGRGASSRINFGYNADNQLQSVTLPLSNPQETFYDAKGNLFQQWSAQDIKTEYTNDAIGRTTTLSQSVGVFSVAPPNPDWSPFETTTMTYSDRNQMLTSSKSLSGQSQSVTNVYDAEGNLTSVTRTWSPNQQSIPAQATTYQFDLANRMTRQTEPDGTYQEFTLDPAGNVTTLRTRRGYNIGMVYNALNRMTNRSVPAVTFGAPQYPTDAAITPIYQATQGPYAYSRPAENQVFTYKVDGQLESATGLDANVTRTYFGNGQQSGETQEIKTLARTGTAHSYTVAYTYDKNGRRKSVTVGPQALFPGGAGNPTGAMNYNYYSTWGGLSSVTDIQGNSYSFTYNAASVLTGMAYPGGVSEALGYDGDWRLTSDVITRAVTDPQPFPQFGSSIRNFAVTTRNARGQILDASDAANTVAGFPTLTYTGLGMINTSYSYQRDIPTVIGYPATFESNDAYIYNGLGDIIKSTEGWGFSNTGGAMNASVKVDTNTYNASNRVISRKSSLGTTITTTTYSYDAGNIIFESSNKGGANPISSERASFFGADDKLLAVDQRVVGWRRFEEFRYDPLGRRVWVRFMPTGCAGTGVTPTIDCFTPSVRRTIWDGAQEVAEVSAVADPNDPATEELDTGWPLQPYQAFGGLAYGDPNPHYGRAVYSPGLAIDQPMSVTRFEYRDRPTANSTGLTWPTFSLMVFWDYRGAPAFGLYTDGTWAKPYTLAGGQTNCPLNDTPQRCVLQQWPFAQAAYDRNRGAIAFPSWMGSILRNKQNGTGHQYLRNRVYDGSTGRFTQEDPIGLAGGLNLYGYANGDPANASDPFGLVSCKDTPDDRDCLFIRMVAAGNMARGREVAADYGDLWLNVGVPGGEALALAPFVTTKAVGQLHHALSTKIMRALLESKALAAAGRLRAQLVTRARDLAAHRGYQLWHRLLDNEVVDRILSGRDGSADDFLEWLRELYMRPDLKDRFPGGLP